MEDVIKQRRNFISLFELGYGPLKFSFRSVRLQSKWVGIIAIKTQRTQIHFLSDVLVAVASLDLKVPTKISFRYPSILVFYNISFSWLLPLDGFQFSFAPCLLRDSELDVLLGEIQKTCFLAKTTVTLL